jgi:hypothetical protein
MTATIVLRCPTQARVGTNPRPSGERLAPAPAPPRPAPNQDAPRPSWWQRFVFALMQALAVPTF